MKVSHTAYPAYPLTTFRAWKAYIRAASYVARPPHKQPMTDEDKQDAAALRKLGYRFTLEDQKEMRRLVRWAKFIAIHADTYRKYRKR